MAPAQGVHQKLGIGSRYELKAALAAWARRPAGLAGASVTGDLAAVDMQDLAGEIGRGLRNKMPSTTSLTEKSGVWVPMTTSPSFR